MIHATEQQIEDACMTRSSDEAVKHLYMNGYIAYRTHCAATIKRLIADGKRNKMTTANPSGEGNTSIERFDATLGSRRLLDAMVNAFAVKAMRNRTTLEEAMATSMYDARTVAGWKMAQGAEIAHLTRRAA